MESDVVKKTLRKAMKDRRLALSPETWRMASRKAQACVMQLPEWRSAKEILLYSAFRNECDTALLSGDALSRGVRVLMPRCREDEDGYMDLACISCIAELSPGRYGILEPAPDACSPLSAFSPDLAVIPGLAFDRSGIRLGWGGGYYDRILGQGQFSNTLCVGLAFPFQVVDDLPCESWDQPVDLVCTGE